MKKPPRPPLCADGKLDKVRFAKTLSRRLKAELAALCREFDLSETGTKAKLAERLADKAEAAWESWLDAEWERRHRPRPRPTRTRTDGWRKNRRG